MNEYENKIFIFGPQDNLLFNYFHTHYMLKYILSL